MKKINYETYQKPSDFMKFMAGSNHVRIVSSGVFVKRHGMRTAAMFVPLGDCTEDASCEFCAKGNEPKQKWSWIAYNKDRKEVRVLDAGPQIGDQICTIAIKSGDPQKYDITITKTGEGIRSKYTVVKDADSKELTPDDLKIIEGEKAYLIKKHFTKKETK